MIGFTLEEMLGSGEGCEPVDVESDDDFALRIASVANQDDAAAAHEADGPDLDALGAKYGLVRVIGDGAS